MSCCILAALFPIVPRDLLTHCLPYDLKENVDDCYHHGSRITPA